MTVTFVMLLAAWVISTRITRRALPFESLVAMGTAGIVMLLLLYSGRFG